MHKHKNITILLFTAISTIHPMCARAESGLELDSILQIPDMPPVVKETKILLNIRARYEFADQDGRQESNAFTVRTRLGFETGSLEGFSALVELEDVRIIGPENNFNPYPQPGRTVVGDPKGAELNRAQIAFEGYDTWAVFGRQRIILDEARYIGNVGWRQNEQTFDAFTIKNESLTELSLDYGYIDKVHRIFGDDAPLAAQREFDSSSHFFRAAFTGWEFARITVYAFLLDLKNAAANSIDTTGINLDGSLPLNETFNIKWRLEYARQKAGSGNPAGYEADYYHLRAQGSRKGLTLGVGIEVLGSDKGQGFRTPLATLHKFNGWADVFLATPPSGLEDFYIKVAVNLPHAIPASLIIHRFTSEAGDSTYGHEIDAVISKKLGERWTLLAKYAMFDGRNPFADRKKFWFQTEYKF